MCVLQRFYRTHSESNKLDCARTKSDTCNTGQDTDEPDRVAIELESHRFREKHRPDQRALSCIKTCRSSHKTIFGKNPQFRLPVRTTSAKEGRPVLPSAANAPLILTILVPAYKKLFALSPCTFLLSFHCMRSSSRIGTLLIGTLSPVNILSLTIVSPERRNMSAGK